MRWIFTCAARWWAYWFERLAPWPGSIEHLQMAIAWRCPVWLVRWCVVRAFAHATTRGYGDTHPDDVNYSLCMRRLADPIGGDAAWSRRRR